MKIRWATSRGHGPETVDWFDGKNCCRRMSRIAHIVHILVERDPSVSPSPSLRGKCVKIEEEGPSPEAPQLCQKVRGRGPGLRTHLMGARVITRAEIIVILPISCWLLIFVAESLRCLPPTTESHAWTEGER